MTICFLIQFPVTQDLEHSPRVRTLASVALFNSNLNPLPFYLCLWGLKMQEVFEVNSFVLSEKASNTFCQWGGEAQTSSDCNTKGLREQNTKTSNYSFQWAAAAPQRKHVDPIWWLIFQGEGGPEWRELWAGGRDCYKEGEVLYNGRPSAMGG